MKHIRNIERIIILNFENNAFIFENDVLSDRNMLRMATTKRSRFCDEPFFNLQKKKQSKFDSVGFQLINMTLLVLSKMLLPGCIAKQLNINVLFVLQCAIGIEVKLHPHVVSCSYSCS